MQARKKKGGLSLPEIIFKKEKRLIVSSKTQGAIYDNINKMHKIQTSRS
jgi:hypothetical protein